MGRSSGAQSAPIGAGWGPGRYYALNELVHNAGILYVCQTPHVSRSTFDVTELGFFTSLTIGTGGGGGGGTPTFTVISKSTNYTPANGEMVLVDATSGDITITGTSTANFIFGVLRVDSSAHTVTLTATGGVDGGTETLNGQYQGRIVIGTGTGMSVWAERTPFGSPSALGGASDPGTSWRKARADHVHDTTALQFIMQSTIGNAGSSKTLNLGGQGAAVQDVTLNSATCAVTVTGFPASGYDGALIINFHQDATGSRKVTWTDTITWREGYAPVIAKAANALTTVTVYSDDGGTTIYGTSGQRVRIHRFVINGALSVVTGKLRLYFENDSRVCRVRMSVGDTPVTTSAVCDLNLSGTTMYTTQGNRPNVAAGSNTNSGIALPDIVDIPAGGYLTVDVDQASGSGYMVLDVTVIEAV